MRRFLKPLYEHKSLTREEYKRVAKAATHALVEARGSDCGLEFEEADVIRAVEQGRARL